MRSARWAGGLGLGLGAAILLLAQGCPGDRGSRSGPGPKLEITNDAGRPTTRVAAFDSVMVSLKGVSPRTHYDFVVTPAGSTQV